MTATEGFGQLAAGFRLALVLFAFMSLLTVGKWKREALSDARLLQAQQLSGRAWTLLAAAVIAFSPAHAGWLLGYPAPPAINRAMDATASFFACLAFMKCLAFRGLMRGLSWSRVRRGLRVNLGVMVAVVGAVWLNR